jgi:putative transposase
MQDEANRVWRTRSSTRLAKYDYTCREPYFVTICARNMDWLLVSVGSDGEVTLSEWGRVVEECWLAIPEHFPNAALDSG